MCGDSPHTHTHKQSHTPLEFIAKIEKKRKEKKEAQRMWRPLCFHLIQIWNEKKNWKNKIMCVCEGNAAKAPHTHNLLFSKKKIKKTNWKKKKWNFVKSRYVSAKYSLSSNGRAHDLRGDAGSNPAVSIVSICVPVCARGRHTKTAWNRVLFKCLFEAKKLQTVCFYF